MKPFPKFASIIGIITTVLMSIVTWTTAQDPANAILSGKAVAVVSLLATITSALSHSLTGTGGKPQ